VLRFIVPQMRFIATHQLMHNFAFHCRYSADTDQDMTLIKMETTDGKNIQKTLICILR